MAKKKRNMFRGKKKWKLAQLRPFLGHFPAPVVYGTNSPGTWSPKQRNRKKMKRGPLIKAKYRKKWKHLWSLLTNILHVDGVRCDGRTDTQTLLKSSTTAELKIHSVNILRIFTARKCAYSCPKIYSILSAQGISFQFFNFWNWSFLDGGIASFRSGGGTPPPLIYENPAFPLMFRHPVTFWTSNLIFT